MKTAFFIILISVIFFVGFWYIFLPEQTFNSVEAGIKFNYSARMNLLGSSSSVDDFKASFSDIATNGELSKEPVIEVSVFNRSSDVSLDNLLLMRHEETWAHSIQPVIEVHTKKYDGIQYDWVNRSLGGRTVVLDAGDRVVLITMRQNTPEAIKTINLIIGSLELSDRR